MWNQRQRDPQAVGDILRINEKSQEKLGATGVGQISAQGRQNRILVKQKWLDLKRRLNDPDHI